MVQEMTRTPNPHVEHKTPNGGAVHAERLGVT